MYNQSNSIPIQQTVASTQVIPNYGTTTGIPIQSTVPITSTYQTQVPSTFTSSTQPQTKYKIWNMLVPAFQPEPQPQPVQVPQPVSIPEPIQTYEVPAQPTYETYEEPTTYTVPETTQYVETAQYQTTATPSVNVIRRGSGITMNEQQSIINCAIDVYQNNREPFSNNTEKAVKRTLGGD